MPVYRKAMHGLGEEVRFLAINALRRWGSELTHEECIDLEKEVEKHPDDSALRVILLGYYLLAATRSGSARKNRYRHILWLVANAPEVAVLGGPHLALDPFLDGEIYEQAKELWRRQIEANPDNMTILDNAARAFTHSDMEFSKWLWKKAQRLEPENPKWSQRLGSLLGLGAKQSLAELERAYGQTADELGRFWLLPGLATAALHAEELEKAQAYASEVLRQAEQPEYFYHKNGSAIHYGHLVLGRLALRSGNREMAKLHLLESGKTEGVPHLCTFGPNMMLAKELLECGEREAVIQYLDLCTNFWQTADHRPERWIHEIQRGQMPDFGANLVY
ncbi:MAG TPA: hypothetical protein VG099_15365 [Gemmataceae bacterium]|nr:hypothetical protein [Gemmataceae bacterium]